MRKTKTSRTQSLRVRHMTIYSRGEMLWSRSLIEPYISSSHQLSLMCCDRCSLLFAVFLENRTNLPRRTEDLATYVLSDQCAPEYYPGTCKSCHLFTCHLFTWCVFFVTLFIWIFFSCNRWKDTGTLSLLYNISIWI